MMEIKLPAAGKVPPRTPSGFIFRLYIMGVLGFSFWSLALNRAEMEAGGSPLLVVRGYPIGTAALVEILELVFLLVMAGSFIALRRRVRTATLRQNEEFTARLKRELRKVKKREKELENAITDLERFNALATGREQRILDLKDEVNTLLQEMDQPIRYNSIPAE